MNQSSEAAQPGYPKKEVVLVAGMHRSGTSAFTRVCNLLGGSLPHPLVEPAVGNELGHWEPAAVVAMDDRALLAAGGDVNSVHPVSPLWLQSTAAKDFTAEVATFIGGLGDAPQTWFIKDPRISVLAGLWREGVERSGVQPRLVIAFRNPWEVAVSLASRQLHHFPDEVWPIERGLALWLNYVLTVEKHSRGLPRSFVGYEGFLEDWRGEIVRVYRQLGLPGPVLDTASVTAVDDFLRPDHRRVRQDGVHQSTMLAAHVHRLLLDRADDPEGGASDFDSAAAAFARSFDVLGGYMRALETRVSEFGPLKARASSAEAVAEDLRKTVEANDLRITRVTAGGTWASRLEDDEDLGDPEALKAAMDRDAFVLLNAKHKALTAAHGRAVEMFKANRAERDAEAHREIQALTAALEDKDVAIAALKSTLSAEQQTGEVLRQQAVALRERLAEVSEQAAERSSRAQDLLAQALAEARAEIDQLRRSRSWRITKPLRALSGLGGRR
jgi:hypothetical protein